MARVLIVEDELVVARDLEASLTAMGHEVVGIATNASDALSLAEDEKPDLALVDIRIKGDRDGISLAAYLKQDAPIRIVFLTSYADKETVERASAVNASGYLLKPFTEETLFASLSVILSQSGEAYKSIDLEAVSEKSVHTIGLPQNVMEAISDYVGKNIDKEVNLAELAAIANLSDSTFSRRFKVVTGITPYQYVMNERIAEAKRLLRGTSWRLVDISSATGFSSQSHFTTAFKNHVGLTPLAYRRL
ncbi:MAG: response regulator transcription factor [Pseudomonadota bacterium]